MVGEAGEGIAESLMAELVFQRTLFGNVHKNNFATIELAVLVEDVAAAEPGFQNAAVFAFPFTFNGLEGGGAMEDFGERTRMAKTENNAGGAIGGEELVRGIVAEHGGEGLIDVEEIAVGVAMADAVRRIIEEGTIEGLRMAQCFFRFLQFGAEFLFLESAANDHGQFGNVLTFDVLEWTVGGEVGEKLRAGTRGQEDQSTLLDGLQKELEGMGTLNAGAGVLDDDDVVGGSAAVAGAVSKADDGIGGNDELALFQGVEAGINRGGIAMNEEDVEGAAAVRRSARGAHTCEISLGNVVSGK